MCYEIRLLSKNKAKNAKFTAFSSIFYPSRKILFIYIKMVINLFSSQDIACYASLLCCWRVYSSTGC